MIILGCNNLSISFGTTKILENISFSLNDDDRVGVVGVNGAGKSTLFKIITQKYIPDSGDIFIAKNSNLGYLEQNSGLNSHNTIIDEILLVYSHLINMENRLNELEHSISKEKNSDILASHMKEYANTSENFSRLGGYQYKSLARGILKGLGFTEEQFQLSISVLSGGQKTRLALAKLLASQPDILLLDEPTNHLDISAIEWLEDFLSGYKKSVLLISHDRFFLDKTTTKTLEIENCQGKLYKGNYSSYQKQKGVDREIQQKHYDQQQKEIARMEAFIEQQKRWNREKNIIAAQSRQKAIDRMEKIEKPKDLPDKIKINFNSNMSSGNDVLYVDNLSKNYPGKPLFENLSFRVSKNEKIFILGPNGCGKSTLLKILTGKLQKTSGDFKYGQNVSFAYYDQEQENLCDENSIFEDVLESNDRISQTDLRNALAMFLFTGDDVFKKISTLSGGEKSRVSLVKLMLSGSNLLILDEPTNHLDINSREILEDSLSNYDGTLIVVSHDRYFIDKLSTRIIEIEKNTSFDFKGNYSDYLSYKNKQKVLAQKDTTSSITESKISHLNAKEEKARKRKLEKQLTETESEISQIEKRLPEIEKELYGGTQTDYEYLMKLHSEEETLTKRLNELYNLWEELASQNNPE